MKLRQLEYVTEVIRNGLNVTAASQKLFTSQPGVSSQIKRLEEELDVVIFERSGKHISAITPEGKELVKRFECILDEVKKVKSLAQEYSEPDSGTLVIVTTHTQARYILPDVIDAFKKRYPKVKLQIEQGSPEKIADMTYKGEADIGIATEFFEYFEHLILLPCYRWNRGLLVPKSHPLVEKPLLTLEDIAKEPIITYNFGVFERSVINRAFNKAGLSLNIALTAADAEVIKTYVRRQQGVGICARMAYEKCTDSDLVMLDVGHLFDYSVTSLAIRKNAVIRNYTYDFIQLFAEHLDKQTIDKALQSTDSALQKKLHENHVANSIMR